VNGMHFYKHYEKSRNETDFIKMMQIRSENGKTKLSP